MGSLTGPRAKDRATGRKANSTRAGRAAQAGAPGGQRSALGWKPGWDWLCWPAAAGAVYLALLVAHWPLLRLPYYWDEAGYFIPAALDLLRHSWWIPRSTLANGHPPLLMAVLAASWHVLGVSIVATRATVLGFGAALVLGVAQLTRRLSTRRAAWLAAFWVALLPLVFAQMTLAQLDLPAAALVLWALVAWAHGRRWWYAGLAAAACLTKETAILTPLVLGAWALARWRLTGAGPSPARGQASRLPLDVARGPDHPGPAERPGGEGVGQRRDWWATLGPHLLPAVPLAAWFAYYHSVTGFWMGNRGFLAYNLQTAEAPARIGMALALRVWQLAGYDGMAAITVAALLAWWLDRKAGAAAAATGRARAGGATAARVLRRGTEADATLRIEMWSIVAAYAVFHAVVGGAVLDRYLLPAIAIYVVLLAPGVAAMARPWPRRLLVAGVAACLIAGWFWNPPYPFPYEDNLAYATFVRLQQRATSVLAARHPELPVMTAWPATNELTNPDLGYVARPLAVAPIKNFSATAVGGDHLAPGQYALLYSRIYQPRRGWRHWPFWLRWKRRFFHYSPPLTAGQLLVHLGGRSVWRAAAGGQWAVVAVGR